MNKQNILLLFFIIVYVQSTHSQPSNVERFRIDYDIDSIELEQITDTSPAIIPDDYFEFCDCTIGYYHHAPLYKFDDLYRKPFSSKTPARYLLCSIVSLDSVSNNSRDSLLLVLHTTVAAYGYYYSPYILDYWIFDKIEPEEFLRKEEIYNNIQKQISSEEMREPNIQKIDAFVYLEEIPILRDGMSDRKTNIFLLRINDTGENYSSFQFFSKGEYDTSTLYSRLQYLEYLSNHLRDLFSIEELERKEMDNCSE